MTTTMTYEEEMLHRSSVTDVWGFSSRLQPAIGQTLAVATLLAAAHTCE